MSRRLTGLRGRGENAVGRAPDSPRVREATPTPALNLATTAATLSLQPTRGGRTFSLDVGRAVVVGRGRQCEIVIEDDTVSSAHARLELRGQRVTVADLHSSNGTFLNGKRVSEAQAQVGDMVRFGSAEFRLAAGTAPAANGVQSALPGWMLSGFDTAGRALQFELRPQAENGRAIDAKTWTIGRDRNRAQLVIDDDSVSGAHAQITYESRQGLTLRDLGSTNGTKVDGAPLGGRTIALSDTGQEIAFGAAKLRLSRLIR
jgi:pSer/pThr/pTyr-binding forkhead associated (FHA) protein